MHSPSGLGDIELRKRTLRARIATRRARTRNGVARLIRVEAWVDLVWFIWRSLR